MLDVISKSHWAHVVPFHPKALKGSPLGACSLLRASCVACWTVNDSKGVNMGSITIDSEFQSLIPPLDFDERRRLEKSILAEGVREPIITWDGTIIDGHNRYSICQEHGLECPSVSRVFESREAAKIWIIENQFGRRNLDKYARSVLALQLEGLYAAEAKKRQATSTGGANPQLVQKSSQAADAGKTRDKIASIAGVSHDTIRKVRVIEQEANSGNETAIAARDSVKSGEKSINKAFNEITHNNEKAPVRKPPQTEDGRRICCRCGEPIDDGDSYASAPALHKKCRLAQKEEGRYRNPDKSLIENVAIYDISSLLTELEASARSLRDSWAQSIEINESMGVKLTPQDKRRLEKAASGLIGAVQVIRERSTTDE